MITLLSTPSVLYAYCYFYMLFFLLMDELLLTVRWVVSDGETC